MKPLSIYTGITMYDRFEDPGQQDSPCDTCNSDCDCEDCDNMDSEPMPREER